MLKTQKELIGRNVHVPPVDFKAEEKAADLKAVEHLRERVLRGDKIPRVISYCKRWGLTIAAVHQEILKSHIAATNFIKEPKRQGIHEKLTLSRLKALGIDVHKHKSNLYLVDGDLSTDRKASTSKSMDFYGTDNNSFDVQYSVKYIEGKGGSQDNQHNDIKWFIKESCKSQDPNARFVAIIDGSYYNNAAKEKELRDEIDKSPLGNVTLMRTNDF